MHQKLPSDRQDVRRALPEARNCLRVLKRVDGTNPVTDCSLALNLIASHKMARLNEGNDFPAR